MDGLSRSENYGNAMVNLLPDHEEERLRALQELNLLDTPTSENFDRITRMASRLFQTPISAVSLTDRHRQWFKSHVGTTGREIPRYQAPCAEVTRIADVLVVPDLQRDARFASSLLANSGMRFYAGAPLTTREGYTLGAMCVLDTTPRTISEEEVGHLTDLAAMVMSQIELEHDFGRLDSLSGMPNRSQMTDDLEDLARTHCGETRVNLVIDLAEPNSLNQMVSVLGTAYIDDVVKASSRVLKEAIVPKPRLYHVGVLSYAVILDEGEASWKATVDAISTRLKAPVICHGVPVVMKPIFGISPFRLGEWSPQDVLRTAFSAVQDAREAQTEYAVFSINSDEANRRRITLLTDMREALTQKDQLSLAYQPRIDLRTGQCISAEALLRWKNRRYGNVSPGEFIPLVEQTALVRPVTQWVVRTAIQQIAAWHKAGHDLRVSVNVSALNLEEADFVECFAKALARVGVAPSAVELELTESALIRNNLRVVSQIQQLRTMGVELAIDDFGTGYSTFAYLQKIPASTVKLDQSFIRMLHENKRDQMLVRSMILMAHDLGYRVVAEGVETAEICSFLRDLNCDEIQGYFISRPLPAEGFDAWLQQHATSRISGPSATSTQSLIRSDFSSSLFALRQVHLKTENSFPALEQARMGAYQEQKS